MLKGAGLLIAAMAAAGVLVLRTERARAAAALTALVVAPAALLGVLAGGGALDRLTAQPALLVLALAVGLGSVAGLAALLVRRPAALPLLAVAALPFRVPLELGGQSANLLVPLYLVVAAGSAAYALERLRPGARTESPSGRPGRLEVALAIALVLYAAQALYSSDVDRALKNVVFFYVPFAVLFRLLASVRWSRRLVAACLGVAVSLAMVFAVVGFWEFAARRLLLNPKVIAANQFQSYFRVNSLFFDPNIYGRFLAIVMLALVALLLWTGRRRLMILAAGALAVLWAGLVLTFSQSSFAALLAGLAVVAAIRWRPRPVLVASCVAAGVAVAALIIFPGLFRLNLGSLRSLDRATSGRLELMRGGVALFAERPVWGHGSGSFVERFRAREAGKSALAEPASHTIPITVAAEQGVIGLAAYGLVLYAAFGLVLRRLLRPSSRGPPSAEQAAQAGIAAAFAALVVHTMLYAAFLEDPITWTLLGVALGLRRAAGPAAGAPDRPEEAVAART